MRALVIGGNGFIGSHLVDELITRGWDVVVVDLRERRYEPLPSGVRFVRGDLSQAHLVKEALTNVDIVYHLAWATVHETSNQDPVEDVRSSLILSINLLEECRHAELARFVFVSSGGTVYGPAREVPIPETHPQDPITAYGINKLAIEKYLKMFKHLYGLDYAILRPSVPYGPRQSPLARQGAVAVFLYRVGHGLPVTVWGDGTNTRDYFYISDLVEALVACAERPLSKEHIFNIGGTEEISVNQLIRLVEETVGKRAIVQHEPPRPFDVGQIALDTRRAQQELGWRPKVPLSQGLARTWAWISSAVPLVSERA